MLCWLHPRENGPAIGYEPGGVTTFPALLVPVLAWSQQNYLRVLFIDISSLPRGADPLDPSNRKRGD